MLLWAQTNCQDRSLFTLLSQGTERPCSAFATSENDTEDLTRMIINDFACSQRDELRGKIKHAEGEEQCERQNDCDITEWIQMGHCISYATKIHRVGRFTTLSDQRSQVRHLRMLIIDIRWSDWIDLGDSNCHHGRYLVARISHTIQASDHLLMQNLCSFGQTMMATSKRKASKLTSL